jgi:hypothetical protein
MDYVTRQFINLTKKFRKELRLALSLLNKNIEHQNAAIKEAADTAKQRQDSERPSVIRAEVHVPQSERYKQEAKDARESVVKYWKVYGEAVGILILIAYTTVAFFQLREIVKQYPDIHTQAVAAKDTAGEARDALEKVQRAFIFHSKIEIMRNLTGTSIDSFIFRFVWENSGVTPTKFMTNHISYEWRPGPLPKGFTFPDKWPEGKPQTASRSAIGPHGESGIDAGPIPAAIIKAVQAHQMRLFFWGWVKYRDIFNATPEHITEICYELTGFYGGDPFALNTISYPVIDNCPTHNCFDDECKQ